MSNRGGLHDSIGFSKTSGSIKKAITRVHKPHDEGKRFTDNFGRTYVYTKKGLIYD